MFCDITLPLGKPDDWCDGRNQVWLAFIEIGVPCRASEKDYRDTRLSIIIGDKLKRNRRLTDGALGTAPADRRNNAVRSRVKRSRRYTLTFKKFCLNCGLSPRRMDLVTYLTLNASNYSAAEGWWYAVITTQLFGQYMYVFMQDRYHNPESCTARQLQFEWIQIRRSTAQDSGSEPVPIKRTQLLWHRWETKWRSELRGGYNDQKAMIYKSQDCHLSCTGEGKTLAKLQYPKMITDHRISRKMKLFKKQEFLHCWKSPAPIL